MPKALWTRNLRNSMIVVVLTIVAVFSICAGTVMLEVGLSNWGLLAWLHAHPGARGPGPMISGPEWGDFGLYVWSASNKAIESFCVNLKIMCPLEAITNGQLLEGVAYIVVGAALLTYVTHRIHVPKKIRNQLEK